MGASEIPQPEEISLEAFQQLLAQYPAALQAVSDAKRAKPGQQTLAELDVFRYEEAPARFGLDNGAQPMALDDVKKLVAWKLRHGKFRPTLMKLVSSNDEAAVHDAVRDALDVYRAEKAKRAKNPSAAAASVSASPSSKAIRPLCRLRGIGPATASLLLAVHDQQDVVFFADAAYAWLCGGPAQTPPSKYNDREYEDLSRRAWALQQRLLGGSDSGSSNSGGSSSNTSTVLPTAADVEKVAYVLLAEGGNVGKTTSRAKARKDIEKEAREVKEATRPKLQATSEGQQKPVPRPPLNKRKQPPVAEPELDSLDAGPPPRRSQRVRRA